MYGYSLNTMQTKPLQVHNLTSNKSLAISETSKRILNTKHVRISILADIKNF